MATSNRIRVSVIEGYYLSLQEAGLPLSVCIQLQECKLSLRHAQWTARQTSSGFSVSLFWPGVSLISPTLISPTVDQFVSFRLLTEVCTIREYKVIQIIFYRLVLEGL